MSVYIGGIYNLQDIKYDLLKIIEPFDGYMFNEKDTQHVTKLFTNFLSDLQTARKLQEFEIISVDKNNAVTFDIVIRIHRDRSPKKLKIHVGRLQHFRELVDA
jgi:hypothetical protein